MIAKRIDTTTNITTFNDTLEDNIDIKLNGNTTQDGTPTPDSPIDIKVVNGDNTISVLGKNFYNYVDSFVASINGLTNTLNDDGSITTTGVPSGNYKIINNAVDITDLLEDGQKYTISQTTANTYLYIQINLTRRDGGSTEYIGTKNSRTYTFAVNKTTYKQYSIRIQTTSTSEWGNDSRTITNFYQLEKGEQATAFEKYQGAEYPINLPVENFFPTDKNAWEQGTISTSTGGNQDSTTRLRTIDYYPIKSNTNYFISLKLTGYQFVNILLYDSSKTFVGAYNSYSSLGQRTKQIIVLSSVFPNVEYMRVTLRKTDSSTITIDDIDNLKPQMEYGTRENTSYPYGTTPIELCKIGDYKDSIFKSSGKNLFNKDTVEAKHYITNEGTLGNSNNYSASDYIVVNGMQKVTTSGNTDIRADYASKVAFYTSDKTFISYGDISLGSNTYTIPNNAYYMRITCRNTDLNNTQVEEGETATEYQPYGSGWFIKKNIGKVVLNGSESWQKSSKTTVNRYYVNNLIMGTSVRDVADYLSNYFICISINQSDNNQIGLARYNDKGFMINFDINDTNFDTINKFTTWLGTHNTTVYYVLNTPTYTKITNTILINQLEELKNANSFNKQTTIGQPNANAFFNLSINYPQRPTNFIEECKNGAYCNRYGKLEFNGLTINEANQLVDFSIESGCYDNGDIIGNTYVKKIDSNLLDSLDDNLIDEDFEAYVGAKYLVENIETTEYLDLGKYTVENPTDTQTENRTSFVGYDKLLDNLENAYSTELDYENDTITIRDVYLELCDNLELIPVNTIFTNSTITVEGNPFTNGEKNRDVLKAIEKVSCSFVDIDPNTNKIKLKWLSNNLDYTFEKSDYSTLEGGKIEYGPINTLIIRSTEVESENVSISDAESILTYGEHPFTIIDDYFLYNADKRQAALNAIWEKVHGLKYVDCKLTSLTGKPFLTVGDKIRVITGENEYFDTYILKHKFTYNGAFMSEIESPVLTQQETKTKQDISLGEKLRNTQIIVNKQNGEIQAIASRTETIDTTVGNNYIELNSKFDNYTPTSRTVEIENRVTTLQTDTYTKTQIDTKLTDGSVTKVMTTSGTFDIDGMHYEKTNAPTSTTINEVGVGVKKTSDTDYVLFAGYVDDNNTQYTAFKGQTIVASENMLVENYFVVGSKSRMEDYEDGTGVFYIGG